MFPLAKEKNISSTPTKLTRKRSSITPSKSPSPNTLPNEDCGSAHSHKRCSCFRRPRPQPLPENTSPVPTRRLKKKASTTSMSGYTTGSSPLPSTPDKARNGRNRGYFDDTLTTTPAGPPPSSSAESSTPAGPPPSYLGSSMIPQPVFGSSRSDGSSRSLQFGTPAGQTPQLPKMKAGYPSLNPGFGKQVHGIFSSPSAKRYNQQKKEIGTRRSGLNNALKPNDFFQPPPQQDEDEMDESDESYDLRGRDDFDPDEEQDDTFDSALVDFRQSTIAGDDLMVEGEYDETDEFAELARLEADATRMIEDDDDNSDLLLPTPGRFRGKTNESMGFGDTLRDNEKDLQYQNIARDIYKNMVVTKVEESDDLVLGTEELVRSIYDEGLRGDVTDEDLQRVMNEGSKKLVALWDNYEYMTAPSATNEYDLAIGPDPSHSPFANANFLASLMLQLHLPPMPSSPNFTVSRASFRATAQPQVIQKDKPIPTMLLDWIEKHHNPLPSLLNDLHRHDPAPSASRTFWKDIQSGLLRGKVADVVQILRDAGWEHALETGSDSGFRGSRGFHGQALANIEWSIKELVNLLEEHCPAMSGDWDTHSEGWTFFRMRAMGCFEKLGEFAGGKDWNKDVESTSKYSSFALQSKRAESKVPWNVLQNLRVLYEILSGSPDAIIEASADWCEATVGLVAWWDESKQDNRVVLGRSHFGGNDGDPGDYLRKLKRSIKRAIRDNQSFQINSLNPIEVGLVCVFRGDVEAAIGMIRTWSLPLSSTVAELAALGGWLPRTEPRSLITMDAFDLQDLELLGLTGPNDRNDGIKDNTLNRYAAALVERQTLESKDTAVKIIRDSWELAISILGRLDDISRSEESVGKLLPRISIASTQTLDKVIHLLNTIGLAYHAENQAEKYADGVADHTQQYGEALWYYARAHKPTKVKEVLSLLISYSLVESRSFPLSNELDPYLSRLISDKKTTLEELEKVDSEASHLIQKYLSGYAVLRQFYDARDEQALATEEKKIGKWQGIKNKAALQRLVILINSAADNIRGGLYDESCDAVVSVEFLLVLLGEILPFISQPGPKSIITSQHIEILLRAIEDLQTVSSRVFNACNEFFMTVMASAQGLKGSNPGDLLVQSTESVLGQSQFSLVGSSMAASQLRKSMGSSGVLVGGKGNVRRGWDWRKGLSSTTTAEEVLSVLRLGIAKDLARCWIDEADGNF